MTRSSIALEYLRRVDAGGEGLIDLFADDAEVHFPKWGIARGTGEIQRMLGDLGQLIARIRHGVLNVISAGDTVVVEGTSSGALADGTEWRGGRWCDVFEIRDDLIHRCFVYLDPDYAEADAARYPWPHGEGSPNRAHASADAR